MLIPRKLWLALGFIVALLVAGTLGYQLFVGGTWFEGLYMTVITLSSTGFAEVVPGLSQSIPGRLFTMVLIIVGMGLVLWLVSNTTAFLVEGELSTLFRRRKMEKLIAAMKDHVIVCGAGTTGIEVLNELVAVGVPCVAIDNKPEHIDKALRRISFAYIEGDATSEEALVKAGIAKARGVVTALREDKDNLVVTFMARQLNPNTRIVSRGFNAAMRDRLIYAGASAVVFPNRIGGLRLVSELVRPHVVGFLDRMLRPGQDEVWRIEEVEIASDSAAAGKTLASLGVAERVGLPILALTKDDGAVIEYYPSGDTVITPSSRLVVLASRPHLEALRKIVRSG